MSETLKYLLLANVGNRDLFLAGQEIWPARTKGKEILDNFAEHRRDLTLPILGPVIRFIQAQARQGQLDLFLFCTNQEGAEEKFRTNDTFYFGECIKKLLGGQQPVGKVQIKEITANPNLADSMFRYFADQLSPLRSRAGEYEEVFVALAGGIPACNMALCLQAVHYFEDRCIPLYPLEGREQPVPLQIGSQLLSASKKEIVRQQLGNYEYAVATVLLEDLGLKPYADLARLALCRLNFDFQRAKALAARLVAGEREDIRTYGLRIEADFKKLLRKDLSCLILELYHNAAIKFRKEEYLDFLGRLFRFQEAVLRYTVETSELALQTDIDKDGRHFIAFQTSVRQHPRLVEYLEQQTYEKDKLNWEQPYIPCLMKILEYLAREGDPERRAQRTEVLDGLREIGQLVPLRNKSPLGHGFEGVSLEAIRERVAGFSPERLRDIIRSIGLMGDEDNPYDRVNMLIAKVLS